VSEIVQGCTSKVWLSCDGWTSRANQSYFTVICHFLTDDFVDVNFVLATVPTNDHDASNLSDELLEVISAWNLKERVLGVVADNTATMPKMVELLSEADGLGHLQFWGCVGHLLNIHKSAQAQESLLELQQEAKSEHIFGVVQDVSTRWNSTFV